ANLANARARLAQSEAQFINARLSYNRNKTLHDQEVISDADFDAAKSNFEVAKADVEAAKQSVNSAEFGVQSANASLKEANENLTKTLITAPNAGTISRLSVEKGERVTGASQFSAGTEIMRIANLNAMEANVEVNENDIVRVAMGDTCEIEVDAYLNKKFIGEVIEIATSANTAGVSVDQVTNFDVKIRIYRDSYIDLIPEDNPNFSPLRPGMSATVEIQTETSHNLLTVPIQAVTTRADTTEKKDEMAMKDEELIDDEVLEVVFLYVDGKAKMQVVKTGIQDNKHIIITEGLEAGQEIITGPYRAVSKRLKDGDEVKVVDKDDLFTEDEN
ncbi:efflux RND transporter periplasmic adaptor subunit, partial [Bacteroidota bacterium]